MYSVKEVFLTLQGEGAQAGRAAVFVRFTGCNLWSGAENARQYATCKFCDTDFVGTDGVRGGRYTIGQLVDAVGGCWIEGGGAKPSANSIRNSKSSPMVVLTGGEPLLQVDGALVKALQGAGFFVALETNGTVQLPCAFDWVTMSPKAGTALKVVSGDELKLVFPQPELLPDHPALRDMTAGYRGDVHDVLSTRFDVGAPAHRDGASGTSIVATRPIRFTALCEHHAMPFMGIAKIAYVPSLDADGRCMVIGLSKFIRLVRLYSERFTMQERIGEQIAWALLDVAGADGAMVITRARHTCVCARGVRDGECETTAFFSVGALDVGRPLHVTATKILDPSPRVPL